MKLPEGRVEARQYGPLSTLKDDSKQYLNKEVARIKGREQVAAYSLLKGSGVNPDQATPDQWQRALRISLESNLKYLILEAATVLGGELTDAEAVQLAAEPGLSYENVLSRTDSFLQQKA